MALDFALSEDQEAIADAFGSFFNNECAVDVVRDAEPLGHSRELWRKLCEIEAPGMAASEAEGGGAASLSAQVVVAEGLGAAIAPVPLLEHWAAVGLPGVAGLLVDDQIATVALHPAHEDSWRLVPGGAVADLVVGIDGDELVAVSSPPPMVAPANHAGAPLANRSVREGDRVVLGPAAMLDGALDRWRTLTASALVGIADRSLQIGVAYVLEREQFGRLVGSFQSIQHGLADLPALVDGARFLTHKAAWAHDAGLVDGAGVIDMDDGNITEFAPLAAMAFVQAGDAAAESTDRCLHYHGGYGFSLEYDIQLYFRRSRGWANILADPGRERLRLAGLLWGAPTEGVG